jgi:type IV fimbrial biogenesis protein FimT
MTTKNREESQSVRKHSESGVTLLESMVALTIMAILLSLAIPGFIGMIQDARRDDLVNTMFSTLNYARSEAVKRNVKVSVCPSSTALDCTNSTQWERGWLVFTDPNSNGIVDPDETIIAVQSAPGGEGTMRGSRKRITYQANGFSTGFTDTMRVCDNRGSVSARSLVLSNHSRVRIQSGASTCP